VLRRHKKNYVVPPFQLPTHKISSIDIEKDAHSIRVRIGYRDRSFGDTRKFSISEKKLKLLLRVLKQKNEFQYDEKNHHTKWPEVERWWFHVHLINAYDALPHHRLVAALKRFKNKIESGVPLSYFDDNTIGNKDMGCTWGLCNDTVEDWPDIEDHTFPLSFADNERSSALHHGHLTCPFDHPWPQDHKRKHSNVKGNGCFHRCLIFQRREQMTRERALQLYDERLSELDDSVVDD